MKIFEFENSLDPAEAISRIYTACTLFFEFQKWYNWDKTLFLFFFSLRLKSNIDHYCDDDVNESETKALGYRKRFYFNQIYLKTEEK